MPQVTVGGPLDKLELPDQKRLQPSALFHFLGGEPNAPASAFRFGQIRERTPVHLQPLEAFEQLHSRWRSEPIARAPRIHQFRAVVVAEDDCIEIVGARRLTRIFCHAPDRSPGSYMLSRRFGTSPSRPCA